MIDTAKSFSAQLICTLGAFHTNRDYGKSPKVFLTTTSMKVMDRVARFGMDPTPGSSLITGSNGLVPGYAKKRGVQGIGLYAEIDDPQVPQYLSARNLLLALERLMYQKFKGLEELEEIANAIDGERNRIKGYALYSPQSF